MKFHKKRDIMPSVHYPHDEHQWKSNYFKAIDPEEARRILDEELYSMERYETKNH